MLAYRCTQQILPRYKSQIYFFPLCHLSFSYLNSEEQKCRGIIYYTFTFHPFSSVFVKQKYFPVLPSRNFLVWALGSYFWAAKVESWSLLLSVSTPYLPLLCVRKGSFPPLSHPGSFDNKWANHSWLFISRLYRMHLLPILICIANFNQATCIGL